MASTINASTSSGLVTTADTSGQLELQTANTTRMTIDSSGNVGIGTSSPATKLNISANTVLPSAGAITGTGVTTTFWSVSPDASSNVFLLDSFGNPPIYMGRRAEGTASSPSALTANSTIFQLAGRGYGATAYSSGTRALMSYVTSENWTDAAQGTQILFYTTASGTTTLSERMRINPDGEVWIARTTDAGAFNLQCGGTGVWGAGAYTNGSDARIKEEITPLESGLDIVEKLNPVTYRYKEDWSKDQSIQTGFIAQDLLVALEDKNYKDGVVNQTGEYMSVAYQNIIPILTKALQELKAIVDEQAEKIKVLEAK